MLTSQDEATFEASGLLHIPRAVPGRLTSNVRRGITRELGRLGFLRSNKWQPNAWGGTWDFRMTAKIATRLRNVDELNDGIPPHLIAVANALVGAELNLAEPQPQPLVTPPRTGEWTVPATGWHVDVKAGGGRVPGVQIFVLVDDVLPRAGGTLVLEASHRLASSGRGALQAMRSDHRGARLFSADSLEREAFTSPVRVGSQDVRVRELSGRCGDVFLMDLRVLHAPAPNPSNRARMMLTRRLVR